MNWNIDLGELRSLDLKNIAHASPPIRVGLLVAAALLLLGAAYYYDVQPQREALEASRLQETDLRRSFETKADKAANLELYKEQLGEMRKRFAALRMQLPSQTEIPGLIVDISQTGLASGLEIDLFKPGGEVNRDFYSEKPITLRVRGTYEELARFVSGVAALPRIVTLQGITIAPVSSTELAMDATAKTYRYLGGGDEDL